MQEARLASETDFAGWRREARRLRASGAAPSDVLWTVAGGEGLFGGAWIPTNGAPANDAPFTAPKAFLELAEHVVCHRTADRFDLLYRLLWRLQDNPRLMNDITDADVARARDLAKTVHRASHKMKAFVRFRRVEEEPEETYVAWFEPAHRVVAMTAPFFVRRFAGMRFSLLTPDGCAHWNGETLRLTAGVDKSMAPSDDALEDCWRTYYAAIFNPARLKVAAMQAEMPKRYWRNLPEARLIPDLIAAAETRTLAMVAERPSDEPAYAKARKAPAQARIVLDEVVPTNLDELAKAVDGCRRCPLWRDATQGVSGEGAATARLMIVGEQPGDQEDLAGRPFVGPAGKVLDRALAEAGVLRAELFVTNAVRHFKHEPRGKIRLHKTPVASEVTACRWWLDNERRLIRPRVILAMGATAALSVFGKPTPVAANRGAPIQLEDQAQGLVTYHPSFVLRARSEEDRAKAYAALTEDLALAWKLAA